MSYEPPRQRDPVVRFIGWAMMGASILWVLASGACVYIGTTSANDGGGALAAIGIVAVAAGVGIFFIGRMLARN